MSLWFRRLSKGVLQWDTNVGTGTLRALSMSDYDLVVRNGTVATAADVFRADIGVIDGRIVTIGAKLGRGRREIDAEANIVTPSGVDSHCHIEQRSSMGV